MKTAFLILAILSISNAEEIPIPQGPGIPIDQLGSQVLVEGGYRDTTAWNMKNLSQDQDGPVEQIELQPRVVTENVTNAPRVLTETIKAEPRVITETVSAPIRQKVITQPTVLNMNIKAQPYYFQQDDRTIQRDAVKLPPKFSTEVVMKPVDVPGNTVTNQTFVQPTVKTITEQVQIQNAPEIRKELDAQYQQTQVVNNDKVNYVQVPANTIYTQPDVQNMYYRENVRLNVQDSAPQTFNNDLVTLAPKFRDHYRLQTLPVFGKTIYNQKVIQPVVTKETHEIRLQRQQPEHVTYHPQYLPVQKMRTELKNVVPVTHNVPNYINVPVNVPVEHAVPEYIDKFVRYEIKEPENVYRNVSNVSMNLRNMRGKGVTVNSGPGFFNKNYAPIRGCENGYCESSDEYHGKRRGYGGRHGRDMSWSSEDSEMDDMHNHMHDMRSMHHMDKMRDMYHMDKMEHMDKMRDMHHMRHMDDMYHH